MPDSNPTPSWQAYAERVLARLAARGATDNLDREDSAPGTGARDRTSARGEDTSGSDAARSETSLVRPVSLHQRIVALRLAVALGGEAAMAQRCAPGALSILTGLEDEEARIGAELLQRGLFAPGQRVGESALVPGRADELLVVAPRRLSYESPQRVAAFFHEDVAQALERPGAVLLVVSRRDLLPPELEESGPAPLRVPPLDGAQLALLLAQRYERSAQADTAPIRPRLPGDAAVAALPLTVLQLALRAASLEAALARIAQATAPRRSDGPDLDAMAGSSPALIAARRLVADLRLWQAGKIAWSELSHSLLLYGPPGTGKTWLARAMATSAGITTVEGSFAEWQAAGHLGNLLHEMRGTFERARRSAPAVLVIDELDAVGSRTSTDSHGRSYRTQVINAFLAELDAIAREPGVIVVGTTNHRETIDPAILRPGRLDVHIEMPLPDRAAIHGILTRHLGDAIPPAVLHALATDAIGRSAAEIDAAVRAARADARHATPPADRPVDPARIRAHLGIASTPHGDAMRWRSAVHECGHALACAALGLGTVQRVLLTPGGG
ncbi:AAA family ATPase, partial [Halovulum sp. GXIMD14794]